MSLEKKEWSLEKKEWQMPENAPDTFLRCNNSRTQILRLPLFFLTNKRVAVGNDNKIATTARVLSSILNFGKLWI